MPVDTILQTVNTGHKKMATNKDKIKYILAADVETTGLSWLQGNPAEGHQIVSIGLIVADAETFEPIEEKYVEIKWNEQSKQARAKNPRFGLEAEKVHGLTFDYLERNGLEEEDAVVEIAELIIKYWSTDVTVQLLGHNVATFDVFFIRGLLHKHELMFKFASRMYDSHSLGAGTVGAVNSDQLFETLGFEKRANHNSLEDARMSLDAFRIIKKLWTKKVGLLVE